SEDASLAGHLKLNKLVVLYDSNDISLDGELNLSFSENVQKRFEGYGWNCLFVKDGNDMAEVGRALAQAKASDKPTLIEVKTVIGYGSPNKQGKGGHAGPHGSPLGKDEAALTKEYYGWPSEPDFLVPDEVRAHFAEIKNKGIQAEQQWKDMFAQYQSAYPELAQQFNAAVSGELAQGWDKDLPVY